MAHDLVALLGPDGVLRRADLAGRVDRHTVSRWLAQGRVLQPHPGVLALRGVLSHWSALATWRLGPTDGVLHVSVPVGRHAVRSPGLVVHRVQQLDSERVAGLPVTPLARTLVDTWSLAFGRGGGMRSV